MKTVNVKIADLTGAALDWAVAVAVGVSVKLSRYVAPAKPLVLTALSENKYRPSEDWSQCGPLITEYMMMVDVFEGTTEAKATGFEGCLAAHWTCLGATPLIAICRAVVGVHFGKTVDVPEVLV